MPEDSTTTRVLNFDPALGCTGWSVIDYRPDKRQEVIVRFGEIKPAVVASKVAYKSEVAMYSKRVVSLQLLREQVDELIKEHNPTFITTEDVFFNPKRPNAYAALLQWICVVELLCRERHEKKLYKIPTRSAKQCITGSGGSGKISVKQAIFENKNIVFKQRRQAESISDHATDSIAVGHFFINELLPGILANPEMEVDTTQE